MPISSITSGWVYNHKEDRMELYHHGKRTAVVGERELLGSYDLRAFGADSLADDNSAAFQAAIDYITAAGGGRLFIPPGEWSCEAQVNFPQNSGDSFVNPILISGAGHASFIRKGFNGNLFSGVGTTNSRVRHIIFENLRFRSAVGFTGTMIYLDTADMIRFHKVVFEARASGGGDPAPGSAIEAIDTWDTTLVDCHFWGGGTSSVPVVKISANANNSNEWKFFGCRWERNAFNNSTAFQSVGLANQNHSILFEGCKIHGGPGQTTFTAPAIDLKATRWAVIRDTTEMFHNAHGAYVIDIDADCDKIVVVNNFSFNQGSQISAGIVRVAGDDCIIGPNHHTGNAVSVAEVTNTGANNLKFSTAAL